MRRRFVKRVRQGNKKLLFDGFLAALLVGVLKKISYRFLEGAHQKQEDSSLWLALGRVNDGQLGANYYSGALSCSRRS